VRFFVGTNTRDESACGLGVLEKEAVEKVHCSFVGWNTLTDRRPQVEEEVSNKHQ
jgi:hypothetical protein